tara:strand:- start:544 stop:771 length:228 start_codon:yes stop_codon:yes gene_type:complete
MHFDDMWLAGEFGEDRQHLFAIIEVPDAAIAQLDFSGGETLAHKIGLFVVTGVKVPRFQLPDILDGLKSRESLFQ